MLCITNIGLLLSIFVSTTTSRKIRILKMSQQKKRMSVQVELTQTFSNPMMTDASLGSANPLTVNNSVVDVRLKQAGSERSTSSSFTAADAEVEVVVDEASLAFDSPTNPPMNPIGEVYTNPMHRRGRQEEK